VGTTAAMTNKTNYTGYGVVRESMCVSVTRNEDKDMKAALFKFISETQVKP